MGIGNFIICRPAGGLNRLDIAQSLYSTCLLDGIPAHYKFSDLFYVDCFAEKTTSTVATCGGDTVCLIDCDTGHVMKRFKQQKEVHS